jgi:serine phosphatase RsbU (regulator of sigma subunit)
LLPLAVLAAGTKESIMARSTDPTPPADPHSSMAAKPRPGLITVAFKVALVSFAVMGSLLVVLCLGSYRKARSTLEREVDLMGACLVRSLTLPDVTTWEASHGSVSEVAERVTSLAAEYGDYLDARYGIGVRPMEHRSRGQQLLVKDLSEAARAQQEEILGLHEEATERAAKRLAPLCAPGGPWPSRVLDAFVLVEGGSTCLIRARPEAGSFRTTTEEHPFLARADDPDSATEVLVRKGTIDRAGAARSYSLPIHAADGTITHRAFVFLSEAHIDDELDGLLRQNVGFALLLALVGGGLCHFLASRFTRPIMKLVEEATSIERGAAPQRSKVHTDDEIGLLARTMDSMVRRLGEARTRDTHQLATEIHRKQAPEAIPYLPGFEVDVVDHLTDRIGGTYYDFPELPDHRLALVVAQSSTTGITAAMNVAQAGMLARAGAARAADPRELLVSINGPLHDSLHAMMHVEMLVAVLDPRERTLTVCGAGRLPLIHIDGASGKAEGIDVGGTPLGKVSADRYGGDLETRILALKPGDRVILTNGGMQDLVDESGRTLGMEAWLRMIEDCADAAHADFVPAMKRALNEFLGDARIGHDVVMVTLAVTPADH